jgi:hypothetical protein
MSTAITAEKTDTKTIALNSMKWACKTYLQDLQALPEDVFTKCFGGKARTIADITYEVNLVNDHIGMILRGEEPFKWPKGDWIYAPEGFDTKEKVIAAFEESSNRFIETIEGFSNEQLEETFLNQGKETTRFERCRFMAWHVAYHSGQLNFIQTLLGDDGWHWN